MCADWRIRLSCRMQRRIKGNIVVFLMRPHVISLRFNTPAGNDMQKVQFVGYLIFDYLILIQCALDRQVWPHPRRYKCPLDFASSSVCRLGSAGIHSSFIEFWLFCILSQSPNVLTLIKLSEALCNCVF